MSRSRAYPRRRRWLCGALLAVATLGFGPAAAAASAYYHLQPERVAADTYVFTGAREPVSFANHGNVVNTGFIVTDAGVVVIDTGPSRLYGEAMRAAIATVTDQPVVKVYITQANPVHMLGNNAFDDVPIAALPAAAVTIRARGRDLASHLYDLVGAAMRGTTAVVPDRVVHAPRQFNIGGHRLRLLAMAGHSDADLAVLDETTGVLFTGDLVFFQRAPTTANADLDAWRAALDRVDRLSFTTLVPGHGPVAHDAAPVAQTRRYLNWLAERLRAAANRGDSAAEVMFEPLAPRLAQLAVQPGEYRRSVARLYPAFERAALALRSKP